MTKTKNQINCPPKLATSITFAIVALLFISLVPISFSGSLYAQDADKSKTIEIQAKGKSSDEIRDEIKQKLIAEGFDNPEVFVEQSGDSTIDIKIKLADSTDSEERKMRERVLKLKVSANTDSFEIPVMEEATAELDIDMEGKTNAEIKVLIEENLASEGKDGAKVEVITNSDGEKEIRVELEKEVVK